MFQLPSVAVRVAGAAVWVRVLVDVHGGLRCQVHCTGQGDWQHDGMETILLHFETLKLNNIFILLELHEKYYTELKELFVKI